MSLGFSEIRPVLMISVRVVMRNFQIAKLQISAREERKASAFQSISHTPISTIQGLLIMKVTIKVATTSPTLER